MSTRNEAGRSMGIVRSNQETAIAVSPAMESDLSAILYVYHPDQRDNIISISERKNAGESLSLNEATLLAEVTAAVSFTYALRYMDVFRARFEGEDSNFSSNIYRMANYYRLVELLRISGILREDISNRDKLFLGAGVVIPDIFPFTHRFNIKDMAKVLDNPPGTVSGVEHVHYYEYLESIGAVDVKRPSGKILVVDDDEWLITTGTSWANQMGIEIDTYHESARQFLDSNRQSLQQLDIGLITVARLDPELLGEKPFKGNVYRRSAADFSRSLAEIVGAGKPGEDNNSTRGQILATIGSGQQPNGYQDNYRLWPTYKARQAALWHLEDGLGGLGPVFREDIMKWDLISSWQYPQISDLEVLVVNSGEEGVR